MVTELAEKRNVFYKKIEEYWADLYGEEYSLYDIYTIEKEEVFKIRESTNRIGHIFFKTADLLRNVDDETLLKLGFPQQTLRYIRLQALSVESVIARLDLVQYRNTYKCLEINSDTPTFIKELHNVNGLICEEFDMYNPNNGFETQLSLAVEKSIMESLEFLGDVTNANIVFTASEFNIEDTYTLNYLMKLIDIPATFVPIEKLQIIKNEGLYDEEGRKIDVLYRQTFPIENLIEDQDEKGNPIGLWFLDLVEQKKLMVINPPSSFLLQSKSLQAVIWSLHEEMNPFFSEEEHFWIEEHFLPTYLEADFFSEKSKKYVMKPSFGREGDTVKIFHGNGDLIVEDKNNTYSHYVPIYQEYVQLPTTTFQTANGKKQGSFMFGSFLIGGKPGAIGIRIGDVITDNMSYFLPMGIKK